MRSWDIDGAGRAPAAAAWVARVQVPYLSALRSAGRQVTGVTDLARRLGAAV
ncbi:hypothetical protein [Streptomyces sp. NPDC007991]|uniref:hypothetical protein n=1 Tax=Streptomyces sp. NPDC007991 TaxID=3364803 RepID=UPI0036EE8990